jgi:Flp pilus assembly pilin Flp
VIEPAEGGVADFAAPPSCLFRNERDMQRARDEVGATAAEYAVVVVAIAAAVAAMVFALEATNQSSSNGSCARLSAEMGGEC